MAICRRRAGTKTTRAIRPRATLHQSREPLRVEPRPTLRPAALDERTFAQTFAQTSLNEIREHTDTSPDLAAGDVDAAWQDAGSGEELVGGSAPTPGQDCVDAIGEALGLVYRDGEILRTEEKLALRDEHRWELDPASSEDFADREEERQTAAFPAAERRGRAHARRAAAPPRARRTRARGAIT